MLRLLIATALVLAFAASPAAAATVEALEPCYVSTGPTESERETVTIKGQDFAPRQTVEVLFDGAPMGSMLTGWVGEFEISFPAPFQASGERPFTVTVRDPATQVTLTARVTNLGMTLTPRRASPRRRVRFRGRGFTDPAPVFAHYLYRGKERKTVQIAPSTGPCGTFSAKRRLIPVQEPRRGRWTLQVDQKREYSPEPDPVWVRRAIDVEEVFLNP
jgi:hypothetical protein